MRILVLGATGYVGSRVVPALLEAGHSVVAASSSEPDPDRFAWGDDVDWVRCDVTDGDAVRTALTDVEGVCYLVHSLDERSFKDRDRVGAETVRDALTDSDVRRVVYLSGLVPDVPPRTSPTTSPRVSRWRRPWPRRPRPNERFSRSGRAS